MNRLTSPTVVQELMARHGASFTKSLGQNFLIDENILQKIVDASAIGPGDRVLEVGPGIGVLTQAMAQRGAFVTAVEIDRRLIPILSDTLAGYDHASVVQGDILKVDLPALWQEHLEGQPFSVVANLPYYITSPVIMAILQSGLPLQSMTLMIQKEVADRMSAAPGGNDYGLLSVAVQFYCRAELQFMVPPSAFMPRPKVGSAVITLTKLPECPAGPVDEDAFFHLVRAAFAMRRKTLHNNLAASNFGLSRDQVREKIEACGLSPAVRAEALSLQDFARLTRAFYGAD
ncbi:16S rRNA (adenine(1518)-N(6)/adenine(1519)-N(6))-dimethyltransferase RsmA [Christensenellaceae bacterium NSJ-44]|uniref:Ribosomal RNA small subunit methyltransferase A n=1 Tax=Luoshenia tenuis TaxID=2763654 RepID=A0A926CZW5_9FIRM|nr:16S rRNA (adenine(1518)-N(6)/adenine(1519)-N(6))-dimethyltransferase RsmA [Luoshenia tenuis]MBC8528658.1 16S rRNA (adenine(1518)-N(6)/adenine(1519)-N(6))-dimethyltransferase RsmA [Luoshenia tenuis]